MAIESQRVADNYDVPELGERILAALGAAGLDVDRLNVDDLAPVDAFHIRGRAATEELARELEIEGRHEVLDVGCGLGGTSRFLADRYGCKVTGLDLTEEYCRVAEMLSARVGLADRTEFRQGSALDLPFEGGRFDLAWTEHVQMNVADKARFYGEIARTLKPGGKLAFHDVFAGPADTPFEFPVPWASSPRISHLIAPEAARDLLRDDGFEELDWTDVTEPAVEFFRTAVSAGPRPVGLHLLMGDSARTKLGNLLANLEADRLRVVRAVLRRG